MDFGPYLASPKPKSSPGIGLIGCGGITEHHLKAYRDAGWPVLALCDLDISKAESRRQEYFPNARVYADYRLLLKEEQIGVVDVATHPIGRPTIIRDCLHARKHVLSQKPFVTDLDEGERLCDLADQRGCQLSVNQNGRFAPHFYFARRAVQDGLIGTPFASHLSVHWDHSWIVGTEFENVKHLILFDFAIHWFDMLRCLMPNKKPLMVYSTTSKAPQQTMAPSMLAQSLVEWEQGQSSLAFDALVPYGPQDRTYVAGTEGTISCQGVDYNRQSIRISNAQGAWEPPLQGQWFSDGFGGSMGELLLSLEEGRGAELNARDNLQSLALCFAAIASANEKKPMKPGDWRRLPS